MRKVTINGVCRTSLWGLAHRLSTFFRVLVSPHPTGWCQRIWATEEMKYQPLSLSFPSTTPKLRCDQKLTPGPACTQLPCMLSSARVGPVGLEGLKPWVVSDHAASMINYKDFCQPTHRDKCREASLVIALSPSALLDCCSARVKL